ncbi:MAG: phosphate signaling complex protein PhoU [Candidatus Omnitrophica bacterium]|nr:phosphate signaling complex protein PhoU [Candidatus Omnitrophota bacterium]
MERHFDTELKDLNNDILKIGTLAQGAIYKSIESLKGRDKDMAKSVIEDDKKIDELELVIDEKCLDLIARHQPMAKDLRFITTEMKLNNELERIADIAVDIAQRVLELVDKPLLKPLEDIPRLTSVAQDMVKTAIDAFIKGDIELARKVLLADPEADRLRNSIQKELVEEYMVKDGSTSPRAVQLLLIARFLERICDHATNIAEDIIYMVKAEVVKHHPERLKEGEGGRV